MDENSPTKNGCDVESKWRPLRIPTLEIPCVRSPLVRSVTSPMFANCKQELHFSKPDGCMLVSAIEGERILQRKAIVLDLRTYSDYSKSSIRDSIHIGLPSTLLRRKKFDFERLLNNLPAEDRIVFEEKLDGGGKPLDFLIYDNTPKQTDDSLSLACYGISSKIIEAKKIDIRLSDCNIYILNVGYNQFQLMFPEDTVSTEAESSALPAQQQQQQPINRSNSGVDSPLGCTTDLFFPITSGAKGTDFIKQTINGVMLSPSLHSTGNKSPSIGGSSSHNNSMTNSNDLSLDSPVSTSSPISALFKFQLPSQQQLPATLFKIPQNEENMNLESYISAANLRENQEKLNMNNSSNKFHFHSFQFPKRSDSGLDPLCENSETDDGKDDLLTFQRKYNELCQTYDEDTLKKVIPKWFHELVVRSKVDIISQFQKLDFLEKRRLNKSISKHKSTKSAIATPSRAELSKMTPIDEKSSEVTRYHNEVSTLLKRKKSQKRSHSQPTILKSDWDCCLDLDDSEEDNAVEISSGLELGIKNRYKDIFPFENTRVKLKRRSVSSVPNSRDATPKHSRSSSLNDKLTILSLDSFDNYINANYVELPSLPDKISEKQLFLTRGHDQEYRNVRYIATQAPLKTTIMDFYTCILNNKVPIILSLTDTFENGIEKCAKYWADGIYDGLKVKLVEEIEVPKIHSTCNGSNAHEQDADIILRRINIEYDDMGNDYEVIQIQVRHWPDLGILTEPTNIIQAINIKNVILERLYEKGIFEQDFKPTILVHCSAGCGRTGTWCTIDTVITNLEVFEIIRKDVESQKKDISYDPISWTINMFRKQRISMVQNINQFLFVYDSLVCYFALCLNNFGKNDVSNESIKILHDQVAAMESIELFANKKKDEIVPVFI
ncbi:Tyrosine-protein phosphatase 2 [Nakaseomyces bracarensis]|uniref:protein-tyrosine-phosphatase n=1 Tax=Nakaseomyces bracarensis TaxID=273131 RepID=A0ABR4NW35_9SACH